MIIRYFIDNEFDWRTAMVSAECYCKKCGFCSSDQKRFATIVSELASNLYKHTDGCGGEIKFCFIQNEGEVKKITVIACDNGPGIRDMGLALKDRFSTTGTLGLGLSGVRRLSDEFDIQSVVSEGTVVSATIYKNHAHY